MTDITIDGVANWLKNWFQEKLVSGTNIKTINNQSILGSGNITISGGGNIDSNLDNTSTNAVQNKAIANEFAKIGAIDDINGIYGDLFRLDDIYSTNDLIFAQMLTYSMDENKMYYNKQGDAVLDEIATVEDLQGKQDVLTDTGWKNVVWQTGWGHYNSNTDPCQYRRVGKIVEIRGIAKPSSTRTGTSFQIATITDESCRPSQTVRFYNTGATNHHFVTNIASTGVITIDRFYSGNTSQSQATTSQFFIIQGTWIVD